MKYTHFILIYIKLILQLTQYIIIIIDDLNSTSNSKLDRLLAKKYNISENQLLKNLKHFNFKDTFRVLRGNRTS